MADSSHTTVGEQPCVGFFDKENRELKYTFQTICKRGKRGYTGEMHSAHHVLPDTAFKQSMDSLDPAKQEYIDKCKHITPWNINNPDNLIGLPDIKAFIVAATNSRTIAESEALVQPGDKAQFNSRRRVQQGDVLKKIQANPPYGNTVHLPVSWGHLEYTDSVASIIKTSIWSTLEEAKDGHKMDPKSFADALKTMEKRYFGRLKNRGAHATLNNWQRRHGTSGQSNRWYENFTMHPSGRPLG